MNHWEVTWTVVKRNDVDIQINQLEFSAMFFLFSLSTVASQLEVMFDNPC